MTYDKQLSHKSTQCLGATRLNLGTRSRDAAPVTHWPLRATDPNTHSHTGHRTALTQTIYSIYNPAWFTMHGDMTESDYGYKLPSYGSACAYPARVSTSVTVNATVARLFGKAPRSTPSLRAS